jgi:hypothetical protein
MGQFESLLGAESFVAPSVASLQKIFFLLTKQLSCKWLARWCYPCKHGRGVQIMFNRGGSEGGEGSTHQVRRSTRFRGLARASGRRRVPFIISPSPVREFSYGVRK